MITIPLKLGTFKGPDKGTTRFTEMAVQRILSGVFKDDPFPKSGCTFGDKNCLVGPGCDKAGVCYKLSAKNVFQKSKEVVIMLPGLI